MTRSIRTAALACLVSGTLVSCGKAPVPVATLSASQAARYAGDYRGPSRRHLFGDSRARSGSPRFRQRVARLLRRSYRLSGSVNGFKACQKHFKSI